jgi:two-component system CheB/CheR fusion protein
VSEPAGNPGAGPEASFEALLEFLQRDRGFDFTGYKRPSLQRRVERRMQALGLADFQVYADYLQVHPGEFLLLFNSILINVTAFFRDAPAWDYLRDTIVPQILARKGPHDAVRVWSAGTASGEEAYSAAILLAEALGIEDFKERVKVYATDVDDDALNQARQATYAPKQLEDVPPALRERYFEPVGGRLRFRTDLRRAVIFGRHDLVRDAPISRLDLLICRNTLMYFNSETQGEVLERFHYALNDGRDGSGYLFLGRAEMMLAHGSLFRPVDLKHRIFEKVPAPGPRGRAAAAMAPAREGEEMPSQPNRLLEQALDESPVARIVVAANGTLSLANQRARLLFSLNPRDLGRPLQDLEVSYRPLDLRTLIEQAYAEKRTVTQTSVERRFPGGEAQFLDVMAAPLYDEGQPLGVSISFVDVTRAMALQDELQRSREMVQTTNEELQSANEELETTNEELQSSNEELETTNEELQSTNEELETMNEELQSTNEELQTLNEELRQRTDEANHLNAFLQAVMGSFGSAAIVVGPNLEVTMWNPQAEDLWGLRADEVRNKSILNLDIGLPVAELRPAIRAALAGEKTQVLVDAVNRRGRRIRCRVACTPLDAAPGRREGVILLVDEVTAKQ